MKKNGCKGSIKGFTLIELLVVVLIIGILAAIALPQYQKAVERARMAEAIQVLDDVTKAQYIYYLYQGAFADDLEELNTNGDIQVQEPENAWGNVFITPGQTVTPGTSTGHGQGKYIRLTRQNGKFGGGMLCSYVHPDGFVRKGCSDPSGTTEFCTMAHNFGYELPLGGVGLCNL